MRLLQIAGVLIAAVQLCPVAAAHPVKTESGAISGLRTGGINVYEGIPFAAPPIGELRWRPPAPPKPWAGTRAANAFAPACMQEGVSMPGETPPAVSEDCLYLNIWAPPARAPGSLPVIVWIYGGGYRNGSAAMPLYWGDRLARKGVIVVTIAYRLGPLGFLALAELTRESPRRSSGNYGLMDQIAALEWVQRNIAAFGGDAKRVTVAGQSSGAISVSVLMASPRAKGLFQRAIGESGGLFEPLQLAPKYLLANAERDGEKYAASLGVTSLKELRRLPAASLLGGANAGGVTHPVVEPYVLPVAPYEVFATGQQNDVPLLIGSNAEEARALTDVADVKAATFNAGVEASLGALPAPIMAAYPHATDDQARQARLDLERDLRFGWDMWAWARLQAATGQRHVYYYSFRQKPPFPAGSVYEGWGASHFAELWYVFDHLNQAPWRWTAGDRRLAEDISRYWTNFASFGDPNGVGLPPWPAFAKADGRVLYLGDPIAEGGVANVESLTALDALYSAVRGASFGASFGGTLAARAAWPDTFVARVEALALLQTLNAELLSHDSATLTLEHWCGVHRLASPPRIVAVRVPNADKPPSPEQRRELGVTPADSIRYRRVRLLCGSVVLSEADNWYVPGRLTPQMNKLLDTTDMPFGRVVEALRFRRHTLASKLLWLPLPDGWEMNASASNKGAAELTIPPLLLEHRAILILPDGTPFSEVVETYTDNVLAFPVPRP